MTALEVRADAASLLAAILTGVSAPTDDGSQLVDRNASAVTLGVNGQGEALLAYKLN